jgi:very-short-patch-repair endonuclease
MNDFEADIYEALTARGLKLVPQVGCSSFRIDFGVCHPTEPGRFVLAIEADGATYHSSCTARDRDRLRQQMLENLGWRFHRIWSTDWFQRKHEEIDRTMSAFDRALTAVAERRAILPETRPVEAAVPDLPLQELRGSRSSIFPPIPFLVERGAVIDAHAAARLGMISKLTELVAADQNVVHAKGGDGQTPLHFASR